MSSGETFLNKKYFVQNAQIVPQKTSEDPAQPDKTIRVEFNTKTHTNTSIWDSINKIQEVAMRFGERPPFSQLPREQGADLLVFAFTVNPQQFATVKGYLASYSARSKGTPAK